MGQEIVNQVQEAQRVPGRINPRRNTPGHIVIKLTIIKGKDKILKATREKGQVTYQGTPIRLSANFSTETLQARGECHDIFKVIRQKNLQPILYPERLLFRFDGKIKFYRHAKVKRIQHHQTSLTTNAKGTSLGRKHKRRSRLTKIKNSKQFRKW